jgi:hypothetical protein
VAEDIREYMMRWIAWFGDVSDADGLRLDAIKHVPKEFFGGDFPSDPIDFCGVFQRNLDTRRGYSDQNDDDGVSDALLFGESFSDLGSLGEYCTTGMYSRPLLFAGPRQRSSTGGRHRPAQLPQGGMNGASMSWRLGAAWRGLSHDNWSRRQRASLPLSQMGHSVVFYDGNNADPADFVQPGRFDALGELGSDTITRLIDVRRRFGRGGMFNRFVDGDVYVYERVVPTSDGSFGASLLFAITDNTTGPQRLGEFDPRPLIVTEFPPGTVLEEKTGNGPQRTVTVIDPLVVPQAARDRAIAEYDRSSDFPLPAHYGLVYFEIPAGPDRGYVAYAPVTPAATLSLTVDGSALPTQSITTVGARRLPSGAPVPASVLMPSVVSRGATLHVAVTSNASADKAYVEIDHTGLAIPGRTGATGTAEALYDGMYELSKATIYTDLSGLSWGPRGGVGERARRAETDAAGSSSLPAPPTAVVPAMQQPTRAYGRDDRGRRWARRRRGRGGHRDSGPGPRSRSRRHPEQRRQMPHGLRSRSARLRRRWPGRPVRRLRRHRADEWPRPVYLAAELSSILPSRTRCRNERRGVIDARDFVLKARAGGAQ